MVNGLIIVKKDVKIDIAGTFIDDLFPTKSIFYALKLIQEGQRF